MKRHFFDILKENNFDYITEYQRLFVLFNRHLINYGDIMFGGSKDTVKTYINRDFLSIPNKYRKNALSLEDFDQANNLSFSHTEVPENEEYLFMYCEYLIYFITAIKYWPSEFNNINNQIINQIYTIMENISYREIKQDGVVLFVPKVPAAIEVAESVSKDISFEVLCYNHYSLKGDLEGKREILEKFALNLEPQQDKLKILNSTLKNDLFYAFNNLNIRHNNLDSTDTTYNKKFAELKNSDKEKIYDCVYDYCLEAFLELKNESYRVTLKELKQK